MVLGVPQILTVLALLVLFGVMIFNIIDDIVYAISCGGCPESWARLKEDTSGVFSAGQKQVSDNVDSLVELKDSPKYTLKEKKDLAGYHKQRILSGLIISIMMIGIFSYIIRVLGGWLSNFEPPWPYAIILALVVVGILSFVFTGDIPYLGFYKLITHGEIWSSAFVEVASTELPRNLTS